MIGIFLDVSSLYILINVTFLGGRYMKFI